MYHPHRVFRKIKRVSSDRGLRRVCALESTLSHCLSCVGEYDKLRHRLMGHETRLSFIHSGYQQLSDGTVPSSEDMPDVSLPSLSSQGLHSGGGGRPDRN